MSADTTHTAGLRTAGTARRHYRYPGSPPFQDDELDRRLFTGRANEADHVLHSILSSDLFLLYAVSGLGKTSLLNAGVMQGLRDRGYWPVSVRLNDITKSPTVQIREQIEQTADVDPEITVVPNPDAPVAGAADGSLWELLNSIEVWRRNELQEIVLVLDQFEELFTLGWDDEERTRFITDFGEVVRGHRAYESRPSDGFETRPDVKIVLAMREDALGELEALSAEVPQIMATRFRLGPLELTQAEQALREPAALDDPRLGSQRFTYTATAAAELLAFLRTKTMSGPTTPTTAVDPSQLQIVCQYVERAIVPKKAENEPPGSVIAIDADDLGGKEGLDQILSDFYRRTIEGFPTQAQRAVRDLCENGLVNRNLRRLSLEEGEIEARHGVSPVMLQELVDARLLRSEPRVGSTYYELAHDTLVGPILAYRHQERDERTGRRRRWIAIATGVAVVALVASTAFLVQLQQSAAEAAAEAAAQSAADAAQSAADAAESAAAANQSAETEAQSAALLTLAASEAEQSTEEAELEALRTTEEALEAAATAQLSDATTQAQEAVDALRRGAATDAAQAVFEAAETAREAATRAAKDASEAARAAQVLATDAEQAATETARTEAANAAQTAADAAQTAASAAQTAADAAQTAADAARETAGAAQAVADAVQPAANAPRAEARAGQVGDEAEIARDEADNARVAAQTAAQLAAEADEDGAREAANKAQDAANKAQDAANTAQDAANTALEPTQPDANAEQTLNELQATAKAAQDAADTAQDAADTAQDAANNAFASAETARKTVEAAPNIELTEGQPSGEFTWYIVALSGFEPGAVVTLTCRSTANPGGFYQTTLTINDDGEQSQSELCFSLSGQEHWVTGGGVESNRVEW